MLGVWRQRTPWPCALGRDLVASLAGTTSSCRSSWILEAQAEHSFSMKPRPMHFYV